MFGRAVSTALHWKLHFDLNLHNNKWFALFLLSTLRNYKNIYILTHYEDIILFWDSNVVIKNLHMETFVNCMVQNFLM